MSVGKARLFILEVLNSRKPYMTNKSIELLNNALFELEGTHETPEPYSHKCPWYKYCHDQEEEVEK